jgi:RimJ/RimL family protein N-acetyltransferase
MIGEVAAMALREGCGALRWEVLAWNQPAIDFYKRLGAIFLDDWKAVRIEGEALRRLAEQSTTR